MSEIRRAYIYCLSAVQSKNYINKNGNPPQIGDAINGIDIVFNVKDLIDNKWMFHNDDSDVIKQAKEQIENIKRLNDWVGILE